METNPTNSFSATTPTGVLQTIYVVHDFVIGNAWNHEIGSNTLAGSYIPANTIINVLYTNSTSNDCHFNGRVEYLY